MVHDACVSLCGTSGVSIKEEREVSAAFEHLLERWMTSAVLREELLVYCCSVEIETL